MSGLEMKYFVLNPHKRDAYGNASRKAILAYSKAIREENKDMSEDLLNWLGQIRGDWMEEILRE